MSGESVLRTRLGATRSTGDLEVRCCAHIAAWDEIKTPDNKPSMIPVSGVYVVKESKYPNVLPFNLCHNGISISAIHLAQPPSQLHA